MSAQFDHVSVLKNRMCILAGYALAMWCNLKMALKTLGVILPSENALTFETHVPERMEIISGECRVQIAESEENCSVLVSRSMCQAIAVSKLKLMMCWTMFAILKAKQTYR